MVKIKKKDLLIIYLQITYQKQVFEIIFALCKGCFFLLTFSAECFTSSIGTDFTRDCFTSKKFPIVYIKMS